MQQTLILCDQSGGRPPSQALVLDWQESVPLTPRTLIMERVRIEWERRGAETAVSHSDAKSSEARANDALPLVEIGRLWRDRSRRPSPNRNSEIVSPAAVMPLTLERVTELALEGFIANAFFLIVDGRQLTELDEAVPFKTTSKVTFVRLLPLVGG